MASTTVTDIGALIVRTELKEGRPRLAGTGITVHRLVRWTRMGWSPEKVVEQYGHLSLALVHAGLAYYYANRAAIDAEIAAEEEEEDRLEREALSRQEH